MKYLTLVSLAIIFLCSCNSETNKTEENKTKLRSQLLDLAIFPPLLVWQSLSTMIMLNAVGKKHQQWRKKSYAKA